MDFFSKIASVDSVENAYRLLLDTINSGTTIDSKDKTNISLSVSKIQETIDFAQLYHQGQFRKSGLPYIVHPMCVASIVAYYGGDTAMICASLLHDVVEDTACGLDEIKKTFGEEVAKLVDALTKIVEIKQDSNNKSEGVGAALTFRKMLIASVTDVRALVIKISDRLHNMITLDFLSKEKQKKIARETLLVYAPIAHRLGMSAIKNELEDRGFYYLFRDDYIKINNYINDNRINLQKLLDNFADEISKIITSSGTKNFKIESRIKRPYSIYLKMQKKGVEIDEILDLLALRIIVDTPIDCYNILGLIHLKYKPVVSRFKDYIALPKENGYQTIHTTVFTKSSIYEIQIRSFDMHKSAEYGLAAHWKYKEFGLMPKLNWLTNLDYKDHNIEEFYELAKNDLYQEDIVVFSPDGDTYSLPLGSVALDYAYAVHTELGDEAKKAYVNNQEVPLLHVLKSGDIVRIVTGGNYPKCTWIDIVKTSRAKSQLKFRCALRLKEVDTKIAVNILTTIFNNPKLYSLITKYLNSKKSEGSAYRAASELLFLQNLRDKIFRTLKIGQGFISRMIFSYAKLKPYHFSNIELYSGVHINGIAFDCCCHPKTGDEILAFLEGNKAVIHHKLCSNALKKLENYTPMLFARWDNSELEVYKIIIVLENNQTTLSSFLHDMTRANTRLRNIDYNNTNTHFMNCEIVLEGTSEAIKKLRLFIKNKYKVIEFKNFKDVYQ